MGLPSNQVVIHIVGRLADAERSLTVKETKKALEARRIASNKIEWSRGKLADIGRTELRSADSRIFPFWYAPVIIMEAGKLVVKLMRYHCRPERQARVLRSAL